MSVLSYCETAKKAIKAQGLSWHGKTDSHPVLLQAD